MAGQEIDTAFHARMQAVHVLRGNAATRGSLVEAYPVVAAQQLLDRVAPRVGRGHQHHGLVHQRLPVQPARSARLRPHQHRGVDGAVPQFAQQPLRAAPGQVHVQFGIVRLQHLHRHGQQRGLDGIDGAQRDLAGHPRLAPRAQGLQRFQRALDQRREFVRERRGTGLARRAVEQGLPEMLLQVLDVLADRARGQVHFLGGGREGAPAQDGAKGLQEFQFH